MSDIALVTHLLEFAKKVNALKELERKSYVGEGDARESVAEHTVHMAFLAQVLSPYLTTPVDLEKVFQLILIHDLPEIVAGDTFAYDFARKAGQHDRETEALTLLVGGLPSSLASHLRALWDDFAALGSREARFVQAIDRLQGFLQQVITGGRLWKEEGVRREWTVERTRPAAEFDPLLGAILSALYKQADEAKMWERGTSSPRAQSDRFDVVIVGGGPAGLLTAYRILSQRPRLAVAIVDEQLRDGGAAGGLAAVTGTKLSLPPAGMGLLPLAGSEASLKRAVMDVLAALGVVALVPPGWKDAPVGADDTLTTDVRIRNYQCVMLSPDEMTQAVGTVLRTLLKRGATFLPAQCSKIRSVGSNWSVTVLADGMEKSLAADAVLFAAGRSAAAVVMPPELPRRSLKGVDVGLRFEFDDLGSFSGLSAHGDDAKILWQKCRVFCVNSPGRIERYPFRSFTIPGGVFDHGAAPRGNFGILRRMTEKTEVIGGVESAVEANGLAWAERPVTSLAAAEQMGAALYGPDTATELLEFARELERAGLVEFRRGWAAHFPLMDWHWDTYCEADSLRTASKGLYVVGDAAGHARGILQAAVSGWLGAGSYLDDTR